jgi:hypothetical protein
MTKDKSSIEIETSGAFTPRPHIVDVTNTLYRTSDKKVLTIYIIKYSDGRICQFKKEEEREDDRTSRLKAVAKKFKELVEKRESIQNGR